MTIRSDVDVRNTASVGHPTAIRKAETRRQKHDRRDAALLLQLLRDQIDYAEFCRRGLARRS